MAVAQNKSEIFIICGNLGKKGHMRLVVTSFRTRIECFFLWLSSIPKNRFNNKVDGPILFRP